MTSLEASTSCSFFESFVPSWCAVEGAMNRRDLVAAAALFPGAGWLAACAAASSAASASASAPVAPLAPFSDTEPWWRDLRRQFYIADGIFLNTGTFGASPRAVMDATV